MRVRMKVDACAGQRLWLAQLGQQACLPNMVNGPVLWLWVASTHTHAHDARTFTHGCMRLRLRLCVIILLLLCCVLG